MKLKNISHIRGLSGPIAFAFDSKSKPGSVIVHSIRFETVEIADANFDEISFKVLHRDNDPRVDVMADCIKPA